MMTTPKRRDDADVAVWARLCALFEAAVMLQPVDLNAFLRDRCPDEPGIRRTVLRMIEADERDNALDALDRDLTALRRRVNFHPRTET